MSEGRKLSPDEVNSLGLEQPERKLSPDEVKGLGLDQVQSEPSQAEQFRSWLKRKASDAADEFPSYARAGLMGATLNTAPRILSAMGDERPLPELQKLYTDAAAAHPVLTVGGALMSPNPAGKLTGAAGVGARLATAAGQGYVAGRFGAPIGDEKAPERGTEGALASAGMQAGMEVASPVLGRFAGALRTMAGGQAIKAAGFKAGITNPAKRAGIPVFDAAGEEALPKLGNQMLDEGLIPFGGSKAAVLKRANSMMRQAGNAQSAAIARADLSGVPADADAAANAMQTRLGQRIDPAQGGDLQTARGAEPAQNLISDTRATGRDAPGSYAALNKLKQGGYDSTNWTLHPPNAMGLKRQTNSALADYLETAVEKAAPGAGADLRAANQSYGVAAKTADLAEEAAGREAGHSPLWGSMMLAATGAAPGIAAHSPVAAAAAGVALPLAAKLLKSRGNSIAAPTLWLGSQLTGQMASSVNQFPAASAMAGNALTNYLRPKPDDEREPGATGAFVRGTGGRR